jgi:hypothetical protein
MGRQRLMIYITGQRGSAMEQSTTNLKAALQKVGCILGRQMPVHARHGRRGGLVDVDSEYGLALGGRVVELAGAVATKGYRR